MMAMAVVDPEVTRRKLERELELWRDNEETYRRRGWILHRAAGEGTLATICDRIWRGMARNVLGIHLELGTLPGQLQVQLRVTTAPGEVVPALWEQAKQQEQAARAAQAGIAPPGTG